MDSPEVQPDSALRGWRDLSPFARAWFFVTLLVTTLLCLLWSHYKLFWVDELLEFYTDTKPTVAAVVSGQLSQPFSLEPPAFHLLLHAMHRLLPWPELAARLASMTALLVTEACVFFVSLRWGKSEQQAVAAMLLPLVFVTVDYGPEARVYEVLTACLAVALFCWQAAAWGKERRSLLLAGLSGSLGCAMLTHYYGVLVAVPLLVGEAVRIAQRRRLDVGVAAALLAGCSFLLLDVPFARALAPFRLHYYATGETSWVKIPVTYSWFVLHWWIYSRNSRIAALLTLCMLAVSLSLLGLMLRSLVTVLRAGRTAPVSMEAALLAAALLPVDGLILAQISRAYVPRYSLPAVVGIVVLLPAAVFRRIDNRRAQELCCVALLLVATIYGLHQTLKVRREGAQTLAELRQLPAFSSLAQRQQPIYVQNLARFLLARTYASPPTRDRVIAFYSRACELHWSGRDPSSLFAQNIAATTPLPAVAFARLVADRSPHLLLLYHDPDEEWIWRELMNEKADARRVGAALGGELFEVRFAAGQTCEAKAPRAGLGSPAEQDAEK